MRKTRRVATEIKYRMKDEDPDKGIAADELGAVLFSMAELVQKTNKELGGESPVDVNVRPLERGSIIIDFIVSQGPNVTSMLSSPGFTALVNTLGVLGFIKTTVPSIPDVLRHTKGDVSKYAVNADGTATYESSEGAIIVPGNVHKIIQNYTITNNYNRVISPTENTKEVIIESDGDDGDVYTRSFDDDDREAIGFYCGHPVAERETIEDESVNTQHGIYLNPLSGSYSGEDKGYIFKFGEDTIYKHVQIEDDDFCDKLKRGEVRLNSKDLLKVDLEITQHVTASGNVKTDYTISRVIEYRRYVVPEQTSMQLDSAEEV